MSTARPDYGDAMWSGLASTRSQDFDRIEAWGWERGLPAFFLAELSRGYPRPCDPA